MRIHFEEVRKNKIKSWLLIFLFIILIGVLGAILGLLFASLIFGLILAIIFAVFYTSIMFFSGSSMILKLSGAKPVNKKEHPKLLNAVEGLAISAGIPTPKTYVIKDTALNAFATGRDPKNASITVTTGLLNKLNKQELEGVVAHEMSHIKNYDIRMMMLAAVLVGITVLLSDFILISMIFGAHGRDSKDNRAGTILIVVGIALAILTPIIGQLIRLAVSRKREFMADANGAILTRYPKGLADALRKISQDPDPLVDKANKSTAHLFISMPFKKKGGVNRLFATHPPIAERIKRLDEM